MNEFIVSILSFLIIFVIAFLGIKSYRTKPSVSVLMYHDVFAQNELPERVTDKNGKIIDDCVITSENFKKQMDYLKQNDYHTLKLDEFYDFVVKGTKIPPKSVLITFDDGRKSAYINAYPILKENNFNAVMFLVTSKIPNKTSEFNPKKYQRMSFDEIEKSRDVFEFASHTHNMHERNKDTKIAYLLLKSDDEIKADMQDSLKYADKPYFAYPYGKYDKKLFKLLHESGYKMAFATKKGKVRTGDNPYNIKRYGIKEKYSFGKFKRLIGNDFLN